MSPKLRFRCPNTRQCFCLGSPLRRVRRLLVCCEHGRSNGGWGKLAVGLIAHAEPEWPGFGQCAALTYTYYSLGNFPKRGDKREEGYPPVSSCGLCGLPMPSPLPRKEHSLAAPPGPPAQPALSRAHGLTKK